MALAHCPVCAREVYLFKDELTCPGCASSLVETADTIATILKASLDARRATGPITHRVAGPNPDSE
jgi:hypothetical protein